jgi:alpha,alpha-trehalase
MLQRRILRRVLGKLNAHPAATGFERGMSIVTHAQHHVGTAVVVRMDLKDFFSSTPADRVREYFSQIGWDRDSAELLTKFCTHNGRLPQGAPTSPRLSNLLNYRMDARLAGLAEKLHAEYYEVTADREFLSMYGAEMLLEIARFWASIATYNSELKRYEILGVMGPDEYHDNYPGSEIGGLNNNSYTNIMAVWVLSRAQELLNVLPSDRCAELSEAMALSSREIERWRDISRRMRVVFHDDGVISQFEGYDQLDDFDWGRYRAKYGNIARLDRILEAEGDTPNRYKASKQADVLMLFYLFSAEELEQLFDQLGYSFDREVIRKNIDYYLSRTSHGSTMSGVVHSWVLARSDRAHSWQLFTHALEADISDVQGGTTAEGIHLGAMAGTVDLVQRGHTGIVTRGEVLWFKPCLPEQWAKLRMRLRYREQSLELEIGRAKLIVRSIAGHEKFVRVGD